MLFIASNINLSKFDVVRHRHVVVLLSFDADYKKRSIKKMFGIICNITGDHRKINYNKLPLHIADRCKVGY